MSINQSCGTFIRFQNVSDFIHKLAFKVKSTGMCDETVLEPWRTLYPGSWFSVTEARKKKKKARPKPLPKLWRHPKVKQAKFSFISCENKGCYLRVMYPQGRLQKILKQYAPTLKNKITYSNHLQTFMRTTLILWTKDMPAQQKYTSWYQLYDMFVTE